MPSNTFVFAEEIASQHLVIESTLRYAGAVLKSCVDGESAGARYVIDAMENLNAHIRFLDRHSPDETQLRAQLAGLASLLADYYDSAPAG